MTRVTVQSAALWAIAALLLVGCGSNSGTTVATPKPSSSAIVAPQGSGNQCPANLDFPLCPLPLPGFREAQKAILTEYISVTEPPRHEFHLESEKPGPGGDPNHIVSIQYGVERIAHEIKPCEGMADVMHTTVRGDTYALVCVNHLTEPRATADFAFWKEMGTSWEAMISTFNNAAPYPMSSFIAVLDHWARTGAQPATQYK